MMNTIFIIFTLIALYGAYDQIGKLAVVVTRLTKEVRRLKADIKRMREL